jgi:hypothetical protein
MGSHGTSVLGFEFAGSTRRLHQILTRWGASGRSAAREHVLLDLGFIVGYGLFLALACGRFARDCERAGRTKTAALAALLAWGALLAAAVNVLQKIVLWLELHGHTSQPLPTLAAVAATLILALGSMAAVCSVGGIVARRLNPAPAREGRT